MRGTTVIYQEDITHPTAGSAHYDQVSHKQVTRLVVSGTSSSTQTFYTNYTYDAMNQLTAIASFNGTSPSVRRFFVWPSTFCVLRFGIEF